MPDDEQDCIEQTVRTLAAAAGCEVFRHEVWLAIRPPSARLAAHGWKLHISSRSLTFADTVDRVVPVLLDEQVVFKLAHSAAALQLINSGDESPAAVGKALTIYPPGERVAELGHRLADLLSGFPGPRILSDRQVHPSAPVYYRYGPFEGQWRTNGLGSVVSDIEGPAGETFAGLANLNYRQPAWVDDPFGSPPEPTEPAAATRVLAGKYRITAGIQRSVRGSVFRGETVADGTPVIVKQARAYVGEDTGQLDARMRLRNERRILAILDGVAGVPRFLDHLRHGQDELLVSSDAGPLNLVADLNEHGRYSVDDSRPTRTLLGLAQGLARIILDVHARGVLIRDLSPKNIVVNEGEISIVDYGIAAYGEVVPEGATAGYATPSQLRRQPPQPADDCYALGMTLLFAAAGTDPVVAGKHSEWARPRALQALGQLPANPLVALIADLIGDDAELAVRALRDLAGDLSDSRTGRRLPAAPTLDADLAGEITEFLLAQLIAGTDEILAEAASQRDRLDCSLYRGTAGIGWELLAHGAATETGKTLVALAALTPRVASLRGSPPGLYLGTTGIQLFLRELRSRGIETTALDDALTVADLHAEPEGTDLMIGAAGLGIGHLALHRYDPDPAHLDRARSCAALLLDSDGTASAFAVKPVPEHAGIAPGAGLAHGTAGTLSLLARLAAIEPAGWRPAALDVARDLSNDARQIAIAAAGSAARPLALSWCQGLAGIARALHEASALLAEPSLELVAIELSDVCLAQLPILSTVGQCCGLAGVGSMLIELAPARRASGRSDGIAAVGAQLLMRSAGPVGKPVFHRAGSRPDVTWASGLTGILAFFRGVRDEGRVSGTATPASWLSF